MTYWVGRLIVANVAMFVLQQASPALTRMLWFVPVYMLPIGGGIPFRPWTVFTYMFLHGGLWHLLFNMIGLWFFGPRLEARLGSKHFLWLYVLSGLIGAALTLLGAVFTIFAWNVPVVGASAAVYGVLLGYARYWPRHQIFLWGILPIEARVLVAALTFMSLYGGISGGGNIAHLAHLGGFLGGYLYLKWMEHRSPARQFKKKVEASAMRRPDGNEMERWSRIQRDDMHPVNRSELDRVLAKIAESGVGSLTPDERAFLDRFSPD